MKNVYRTKHPHRFFVIFIWKLKVPYPPHNKEQKKKIFFLLHNEHHLSLFHFTPWKDFLLIWKGLTNWIIYNEWRDISSFHNFYVLVKYIPIFIVICVPSYIFRVGAKKLDKNIRQKISKIYLSHFVKISSSYCIRLLIFLFILFKSKDKYEKIPQTFFNCDIVVYRHQFVFDSSYFRNYWFFFVHLSSFYSDNCSIKALLIFKKITMMKIIHLCLSCGIKLYCVWAVG